MEELLELRETLDAVVEVVNDDELTDGEKLDAIVDELSEEEEEEEEEE